ncbi:MAG: Crp/Fnr family transcriptional regulator [Ilumatobacteraceae bacterium]|nr:Crp/Fnr family transcriptional regulator [Ilumatobacteraceae bacterium]
MLSHTEVLSQTSFFFDAPESVLSALAKTATERFLIRGDTLFAEGDKPDALYVVLTGRIAIVIDNKPLDHRETVVALMESGDLFGELALLDDGPRSAAARAIETASVLQVNYSEVLPLLTSHPEIMWNIVRLLAKRLRTTDEVLSDSVFLDVTGRTAKRILELSNGSDEFTLPVTQEELAGMVGASRERVNKAIASFIRLRWINQQDRRYKILNRQHLEQRSR